MSLIAKAAPREQLERAYTTSMTLALWWVSLETGRRETLELVHPGLVLKLDALVASLRTEVGTP